jgi:hypothetical protein
MNHNPRFRIGKSQNYITVTQTVNSAAREWNAPEINIPTMIGLNPPAANAVQTALGKAIAACRELQKYTGRPA